jgi:hypothetical protein
MRKRICLFVVFALLLSTSLFSANSICDFNGDGRVNVLDLQMLINVLIGSAPSEPKFDVTGDGRIDQNDLNRVLVEIIGVVAWARSERSSSRSIGVTQSR